MELLVVYVHWALLEVEGSALGVYLGFGYARARHEHNFKWDGLAVRHVLPQYQVYQCGAYRSVTTENL